MVTGWTVDIADTARVVGAGNRVALRPRERAVVAALALAHPGPASAADIASLVWGADIPPTGRKAVHNHVLRVRRAAPGLVQSSDDGYRFGSDVEVIVRPIDHTFGELADMPRVAIERAAARERHLAASEVTAHQMILASDADEACTHVAALVDEAPHRVIWWWWWIVLTARLGQRRRALDLLRLAREVADREVADLDGRITVADLDELEQIVLTDDPLLDSDAIMHAPPGLSAHRGRSVGHLDPGGESQRLRSQLARADITSVALTAPSGAGKSSLCRDLADELAATGWSVSWCAIARGVDATVAFEHLADELERRHGSDPDGRAAPLIDRLERAVRTRARRPRLVVIDDVQFLSGDRLEWVSRLVRAAGTSAVDTTVLITSRDEGVAPVALADHHHRLASWSASTVEAFVHHFAPPSEWSRAAAAWIHRRSGGNALFVRELTLDVVNAAPTDGHVTEFVPPDRSGSAASAAALRLGQLGESTRRVLASAALWGRRFRAHDLPGRSAVVERAMAEAHAAGVIERRDDTTWRFRHDAYRDALLGDVDDELMAAVGSSSDGASDGVLDATIAAANRAVGEGRPNDATRLFRRAAGMIETSHGRGARWVDVMVDVGATSLSVGSDDATDVLLDAARRALDLGRDRTAGRALRHACRTGPTSVVGGTDERVRPLVDRALATVHDPAARALVATAATALYGFANDADKSRALYDDALDAAHRCGDPHIVAEVLRSAYMSILRPDDVDLRRWTADELDRLTTELGRDDLRYEACRLRISAAVELGDEDPRPYLAEVATLAAQFGERSRNWGLFSFAAMVEFLDGDLERAEHTLMRLAGEEVVASPSLVVATIGAHLLGLRLAAGRVADLAAMFDDLADRQPDVAAWIAVRSLTHADGGREREARRCFDAVLPGPPGSGDRLPHDVTRLPAVACLGRAAVLLDDQDRIRRVVSSLEPHVGRWTWHGTGTFGPIDLELAWLYRALGDDELARRAATSAVASAVRVGSPWIAATAASLLVADPTASSAAGRAR